MTITIGIPVYEQVDLLDVAGPVEMFSWMNDEDEPPRVEIRVVAETMECITTRAGLTIEPQATFADTDALDVLWVPGGDPSALAPRMRRGHPYPEFLVRVSANAS